MWYQILGHCLRLKIRLSPNAKQAGWLETQEDARKLAVKAPAVEGAANKAMLRYLAEYYKLPITAINLISGHQARLKCVELDIRKIKSHREEFNDGQ